ncbi:MAG: glucosyltransferase domain-containing protein [Streptococcaceae bacterium]|jgi:hypothetical protein|nr:glucosyltransferase domain-containing protein [Streptococcaceae bacterium]
MRKQHSVQNFIALAKAKKNELLFSFVIYFVALCSIGLINYPYIDDAVRRLDGKANFGLHYSRWGSEFVSWIFQGSSHLTDRGLTPFILSALILTLASFIIQAALLGEKINYLSSAASVIVGLNPWFLNAVAYRFDGPLISLSLLFAVLPFIWWKAKLNFTVAALISIFLMYNFYQASTGVYLIVALSLMFLEMLEGRAAGKLLQRVLLTVIPLLAGTFLYLIQLIFLPTTQDNTAEIMRGYFIDDIVTNLLTYFRTVFSDNAKLWNFLILLLLFAFVFSMLKQSRILWLKTIGFSVIYLLVTLVASFGFYLFLEHPISSEAPRYNYGFGVWIALVCILSSSSLALKAVDIVRGAIVAGLTYQIISFVFMFSSMLQIQKESFISSSTLLHTSLISLYQSGDKVYVADNFLVDSEVFLSACKNYPVLKKIVPSNHDPYFPNRYWFESLTNIPVDRKNDAELSSIVKDPKNKVSSNESWTIYQADKTIVALTK